ncbi:hypothetical protein CY35_02G132800 [Sphagnum magellanicum]|nr:hypothetical protein CY35_02G132800 [Sphagnum magellanicum]
MQGPGRSRAVGMRGRWGSNGGGGAGEGGYRYHRRQQQPGMYPLGWELQHLAYAQQQEAQQYYVQALLQQQMYGRAGVSSRGGFLPLGVQAAGILKRPAGPAQGPLLYGRGHARGGGGQQRGRGLGARGRDKGCEPLTKEALDADLDAWRMKDKKFGGDSLDADMDKEEEPSKQDGDEILGTTPAVEGDDTSKIGASNSVKVITMKSTRARTIDGNSNVDKEHVSATRKEGPTKGVDVKL